MFTETEVQFLMTQHNTVENSSIGCNRNLTEIRDLRKMGCPADMFNRVLESRARKLGNKFVEFRTQNQYGNQSRSDLDLTDKITAAKFF
jgi:hypothetical protein